MSRAPFPRTQRTTIQKITPVAKSSGVSQASGIRKTVVSKRDTTTGLGTQVGKVKPSDGNIEVPTRLQKRVFTESLSKSALDPKRKVVARGTEVSRVAPPVVSTKRGKEPVVQQMTRQKLLQRCPKGEYLSDTLIGVEVKPSGVAQRVEVTQQAINPRHATESAGVNQTVSSTKVLSVTAKGRQLKKSYKTKTLKADRLAAKPNLNPKHVDRLVSEEIEDVENTLKMVPPDLVSASIEKFPLKKKLQNLRLGADPVSVLTQSVIHPAPTADEVDAEAPPEVLAEVLDAIEKGAQPDKPPAQIFNSLFPDVQEPRINVSSVAPGPLEDVVVPTSPPLPIVEQALTQEMEDFINSQILKKEELPKEDICVENNIAAPESTYAGTPETPMFLDGELPPWEDATVRKVSAWIGADPIDLLETSDITALEDPADISQELAKGIDYFIDADIAPYETKIQIRGSKLPKWFPGYMSAFSHVPEIVKISRKPSEVLHTAWKAVQPKVFPDDSLLIA